MNIQNIIIDKYKVQMDISLPDYCRGHKDLLSEEYTMNGIVKFQIKAIITKYNYAFSNENTFLSIWIFGKFINIKDNTSIYVKFYSKALNVQDMCISVDSNWHLIPDTYVTKLQFDVYFTVEFFNSDVKKLEAIYDDELTDFELRGGDGSVRVHKCMLAATSPVFKKMFQGDWKETRDGYMSFEEISKATLEDFKQYIYLNTLPSKASEQILIIALRYDIPELEIICVNNIIQNLKAEEVCDLLQFAATHKNDRLIIGILECIQKGVIKIDEVMKHVYYGKDNKTYTQEQ